MAIGEHNLAVLAEQAHERFGTYDELHYEGVWHSSDDLAERAARLAGGLRAAGVGPGERVVVLMANCPEVSIGYNGILRAGAVVTPVIFLVTAEELRHILVDSGAVGVLTTPEFAGKVADACGEKGQAAPAVRFVAVVGGAAPHDGPGDGAASRDGPRTLPYGELEAAERIGIAHRADDDLAALLYTGGTTGRSKGVPLTHANLWWCGWAGEAGSHLPGPSRVLVPLPLSHAYGLLVSQVGIHTPEAPQTLLMRWFDPAGWLALAETERATRTTLVPAMIQMLLAEPLEDHDLASLGAVSSGAAPLARELIEELERRVPSATVYEGYGCTESAALATTNRVGARRIGSVGQPVPGCLVAIRDDDGRDLPPGADGEVCLRSPGVTAGYWNADGADAYTDADTQQAVHDGWLATGDIGHLDDDGYLYIVDRKKDLIIRGGFNVYPRDVEDVLLAHPAVAMAGCVGRAEPRLGEEVVAYVSLRPGATATGDELVEHAKARLASNKYPREVNVVDAVPLTSVGKLDRKALRKLG
jgi:long-chain acyl-CoA synthetase